MTTTRKKLVMFFVIALFLVAVIGTVFSTTNNVSYAVDIESINNFTFTLVTDSNGEQSYSVAIKASAKPGLEYAIIPESYNGLPVTEIANNGFMSCAKLNKVVLPTSIKKIGNNAFMNNAKLERIALPSIESIGMNAFAMCPLLDRTFIPKTVKSVGANIFRNNANTVYLQSSAEEVSTKWQSTWNSYYTGEIVYSANVEDTIAYREILDDQGEKTIGYEIKESQWLSDVNADIVIYNAFRPDKDSDYLPVLNICSEAFTFSQVNSITIKDIMTLDEEAPKFNHSINIRSHAFLAFWGNEVSIEVPVKFDHPDDLQNGVESIFDNQTITGDLNQKSIRVFEEATIKSVTLPNDIDFIPERMFFNCAYLENIKYANIEYDGINTLNSVTSIGNEALSSCVSLSNIYIPSSVQSVGNSVFYDWGKGITVRQ